MMAELKKIYISGRVTGDDDYVKKFSKAARRLDKAGYRAENPVNFVTTSEKAVWQKAMRVVLKIMLFCDGVALLPDWQESKGARIEERLARELGIPVKPIDDWINEGGKE
jgi:ribosomal protein L13E